MSAGRALRPRRPLAERSSWLPRGSGPHGLLPAASPAHSFVFPAASFLYPSPFLSPVPPFSLALLSPTLLSSSSSSFPSLPSSPFSPSPLLSFLDLLPPPLLLSLVLRSLCTPARLGMHVSIAAGEEGNPQKDPTLPSWTPSLKLCFPFRNTFGRKVVQISEEEERALFLSCFNVGSRRD